MSQDAPTQVSASALKLRGTCIKALTMLVRHLIMHRLMRAEIGTPTGARKLSERSRILHAGASEAAHGAHAREHGRAGIIPIIASR